LACIEGQLFFRLRPLLIELIALFEGFPESCATLPVLHSKSTGTVTSFFSVVNCEYYSCCCCSALEQCVFSCMCRESSKCHGMVMGVLNSGIIFSFCDGVGLFFPTHYTFQILLPQIYISLEPSKMPSLVKGLRLMTRLLKKWLEVQNSN